MRSALGLFAVLIPLVAEGRVFDYREARLAAFVRGTGGTTGLGQGAFNQSSGTGTSVKGSAKYSYGGELGVMLGLSSNLHARIGAELIQPQSVNGDGTNSAGTKVFAFTSSVSVFNPNLTFEWDYKTSGSSRYFFMAGAGYSMAYINNKYLMTAAGTSEFGLDSFTDSMSGTAVSAKLGTGLETVFADNITFSLEVGYQYLPIRSLSYKNSGGNFLSSSVKAGGAVTNRNGDARNLNLSGLVAGVGFRFYLNFL